MFTPKKFIILSIIILFTFLLLSFVNAVSSYEGKVAEPGIGGIPQGANIKEFGGVVKIVMEVTRWTYTIFFIIAVLYILFAAYTYLTAQSEPEKIKSATNQIIYAAIAIAVALLAVSINAIVRSIIKPAGTGGEGTGGSPSLNLIIDKV